LGENSSDTTHRFIDWHHEKVYRQLIFSGEAGGFRAGAEAQPDKANKQVQAVAPATQLMAGR
jgi:hypothetical protein